MEPMEFSIGFPQFLDFTNVSSEWHSMKQRLRVHMNHRSSQFYHEQLNLAETFLINLAGDQVQSIYEAYGMSYEEAVKFSRVLQQLEAICLPKFLIIYNRFRFFTCKQEPPKKFEDFLQELLMWSENCEFGDLKDILLKDSIISGICNDALRDNLLRTEELDYAKTLKICQTIENPKPHDNIAVDTSSSCLAFAEASTDTSDLAHLAQCQNENNIVHADASTGTYDESLYEKIDELEHCYSNTLRIGGQVHNLDVGTYQLNDGNILNKTHEMIAQNSNPGYCEKPLEEETVAWHDVYMAKPNNDNMILDINNQNHEYLNDSLLIEFSKDNHQMPSLICEQEVCSNSVVQAENTNTTSTGIIMNNNSLTCSICGISFLKLKALRLHSKNVHGLKCFMCKICKATFSERSSIENHRKLHKQEKRYVCEECGARFITSSHLKSHSRLHTGERPFSCNTCGASFTEASKLKSHLRKHTGEKPYKCDICFKSFAWTAAYSRHMRIHTGEKPYTCELCGGSFAALTSLQRHKRIHTKEKPYQCSACNAKFGDRSALRLHERRHTGERPFICGMCGSKFSRSQHLKEHIKIHTGEKPHVCEICDAKFSEASKLKSHRRKHTGEKPYHCEICGASFAWTAAIKRHMRTHTFEKPYCCNYCGSSFADLSTLTRHKRVHNKERPYGCSICNASFSDNSSLHRHLKIHSGEKPYSCEVCSASFSVKSYLDRHRKIHTGIKTHACDQCSSKFFDASKLKRHQKVHMKSDVQLMGADQMSQAQTLSTFPQNLFVSGAKTVSLQGETSEIPPVNIELLHHTINSFLTNSQETFSQQMHHSLHTDKTGIHSEYQLDNHIPQHLTMVDEQQQPPLASPTLSYLSQL